MKLAEALQERADLNRKVEQLSQRMETCAVVQEGETPPEDPAQLLQEMNQALDALEKLTAAINLANSRTMVEGNTLTELIARRDVLTRRVRVYRDLAAAGSNVTNRYSRNEIKTLSAVNVKELQQTADQLSKELRLLDNRIQQTNWTADL